jgi:peptidoglycan/xylan/chitin deacetylase (PgdA/CDA1 family)
MKLKHFFAFLVLFLFQSQLVFAQGQVLVLCYHTFLGKKSIPYDFSIDEFRQQIQTIRMKGYRFITLKEAASTSIKGSKNILLIIDDGHKSAFKAYNEVLKPYNIKAVFAIYPGVINKASYMMTWDQVLQLKKDGNEIVSHGYYHEFLNDKLKTERPKDFENELKRSKLVIEEKIKDTVITYVYPFGVVTDVGRAGLTQYGYQYAFSLIQKPMLLPIQKNPDLLALPRYMLTRGNAKSIMGML